ncbi:EamA family transporter [Altererythrobacter xixiisoli]|uniref:EamA family transporter n=1 Tax=Croceibacterium xixiisoli TaxID=1476466 RepID=A0A6I4TPW5_9SPHN|nr:DMT family transporter [Croceibacterium xixiisoli]MXO97886.1 EamA family transporter [Croceibacterium xixiisoli]
MADKRALLPFLAALLGVGLFSTMDGFAKFATLAVGAYSALLWRSGFGIVLAGGAWLLHGARRPPAKVLKIHLLRGMVMAGMAFTFFWGVARLPLAEAIALGLSAPLLALCLAAVLLGERIDLQAIGASLIGLIGVMIIAGGRITTSDAGTDQAWGIAALLLSALLYAWNLILQRQQALLAHPFEVAAFQNLVVGAVLLPLAPWLAIWPAGAVWQAIAMAALLSVLAAMLLSWAYGRAEAQALVPLEYSAFLWAALVGWIAFAEPLTWPLVTGAGLIVLGCWITTRRKTTAP